MQDAHFEKVKGYLYDLGYNIIREHPEDGTMVIENEDVGVSRMVIGIADPILIMEQYLFTIKHESLDMYRGLLQKNRDIIHGAFVLDDSGSKVIFRDTLQLENLDLNEIEASLNSLSLLMSEYSDDIIKFSKS